MSNFVLDTDTCIYLIRGKAPKVLARLQALEISQVGLSSITLSELEFGVAKSARPEQNRLALAQFVAPLTVRPYDDGAAIYYGQIRNQLERQGTPIGSMDTLIAAHALALGCTLVTNNVQEFSRVPELVVENWVN
ncbi:MAG: type II toxin-antitoxin system VapC family toxin [Gemmatimonadetes bacterium]|nr:type II toxin-antitoxin system VapC family toxin [Gemmatimonadota bacterium]MBT6148773.1 type II toxin-antitoxin system VapC family toxin [Gemmatimonadota bacterium]MBT7859585.1 type II toxin-antitoxin system VapC family toxin [Gemmatimonadota bacterium]